MDIATHPGNQLLRLQVYEYLRKSLKNQELKPGSTVRIKQLSEQLGISRTPLRDALLQLQAEGFVTFLPQRGILINEATDKDVADIYEVLGALDARCLLAVFPRIGDEEIARMTVTNEAMFQKTAKQAYYEYFDLNNRFHNIYLELSDNALLLNQLQILRQRLFDFLSYGEWIEKVQMLNYEEHVKLIDLIKTGNANIAADFIRDVHCSINW